jgi:hypothetical protein
MFGLLTWFDLMGYRLMGGISDADSIPHING